MANAAEDLALQAVSLVEQLQPEQALEFFQKALSLQPENVTILDQYANCLIELGRNTEAQQILQTSIQLSPNENPFKYMNLGQLLAGHQAMQCFTKGTELMIHMPSCDELNVHLASGLCSMAELYMTDLCDDANAESACESLLIRAMAISPDSIDVLQSFVGLRLVQQRFEEASSLLSKCLALIDDEEKADGENGSTVSFDIRLDLAKMCIEMDRYSEGLDMIDRCLCEDDSIAELWVLAGLCYIKEDDLDNAKEFLERAHRILLNEPDELLQTELDAMLKELQQQSRST